MPGCQFRYSTPGFPDWIGAKPIQLAHKAFNFRLFVPEIAFRIRAHVAQYHRAANDTRISEPFRSLMQANHFRLAEQQQRR
jgi:hypothetical protein